MTRIGWIIIGILVYFLLGWILKDIVFSIITIEGDTTMGDILKYEQIVYSALTAIYIIIMNIVQGDDNGDSSSPIMLVIATYLGARFLPLSMGSVILYSASMASCACLTLGHVASRTCAPRSSRRASSSRGTPCARMMTVSPGCTASSECARTTPCCMYVFMTCGLWMMGPSMTSLPELRALCSLRA